MQEVEKAQALGMAITVTILLSACTPKPEPKTVDYYVKHQAEWQKVFDECRNNPGKLKDDPDCINANQAMYVIPLHRTPKGFISPK